jgi:hypothetical protein
MVRLRAMASRSSVAVLDPLARLGLDDQAVHVNRPLPATQPWQPRDRVGGAVLDQRSPLVLPNAFLVLVIDQRHIPVRQLDLDHPAPSP